MPELAHGSRIRRTGASCEIAELEGLVSGPRTVLASQHADEPGADEGQRRLLEVIEAIDTGIGTIGTGLAERIATVERNSTS